MRFRKGYLFKGSSFVITCEHKFIFSYCVGGCSIVQAVVKEIFKRNPMKLHVADVNENNLTELVRDIYFSKLSKDNDLLTFTEIASNYLNELGFEPYFCQSEDETRTSVESLKSIGKWPCHFSSSDTTGEKEYEEFFTTNEVLYSAKYESLGIIRNAVFVENEKLDYFSSTVKSMKEKGSCEKQELVALFREMLPDLVYEDKDKYLEYKM